MKKELGRSSTASSSVAVEMTSSRPNLTKFDLAQAIKGALEQATKDANLQNEGMRMILEQVAGDYHLKHMGMGMGRADLETCETEPCAKIRRALALKPKEECPRCKGTGAYLETDHRPGEDDPMPRQCELCSPIESNKSYWLIERGQSEGNFNQPAWWLGVVYDISDFTVDASYAMKYETKEEAEKYLRGFSIPVKATEHLFAEKRICEHEWSAVAETTGLRVCLKCKANDWPHKRNHESVREAAERLGMSVPPAEVCKHGPMEVCPKCDLI